MAYSTSKAGIAVTESRPLTRRCQPCVNTAAQRSRLTPAAPHSYRAIILLETTVAESDNAQRLFRRLRCGR